MICQKRKFISKKEAKKFMKVQNMTYRDEPLLTMVYECLDCQYWHVTHKDKTEARNKKHSGKMQGSQVSEELEMLRRRAKSNFYKI